MSTSLHFSNFISEISCSTRSSRSSFDPARRSRAANMSAWRTVSSGKVTSSCSMKPTQRFRAALHGWPPHEICDEPAMLIDGSSRFPSALKNVVFPQPVGPMTAITCPVCADPEIPSRIVFFSPVGSPICAVRSENASLTASSVFDLSYPPVSSYSTLFKLAPLSFTSAVILVETTATQCCAVVAPRACRRVPDAGATCSMPATRPMHSQ
mmetsp:Transcript_17279/g.36081  ORF Transcript_17279/g.36081 Transcript_17279/m.36081 type:complete len:210 (+) Transcript_17279:3127-3756(+)